MKGWNEFFDENRFVKDCSESLDFCIEHFKSKFGIVFDNRPEIEIRPIFDEFSSFDAKFFGKFANYAGMLDEDKIVINPYVHIYSNPTFFDYIKQLKFHGIDYPTKSPISTIAHELGHVYLKTLDSDFSGWYFNNGQQDHRCVDEGISEYFRRDVMGKHDDNIKQQLLNGVESHMWDYIYGYGFVKPIIDKYGKVGIDELLNNCIGYKGLRTDDEFQNKILDSLNQNHACNNVE